MANKNTNNQYIDSNTPGVFDTLLVPVSILLGCLLIISSILFSAFVIFQKNELVTKNDLQKTVENAVAAALQNNGVATTAPTAVPTPTVEEFTDVEVGIDDDPVKGNSGAKVVVVEFTEYECYYCHRNFAEVYPKVKTNFIDTDKIRYVIRDATLGLHEPQASIAANAMQCVYEQGKNDKYFVMHDFYFNNTQLSGGGFTGGMNVFYDEAEKQGLNKAQLTECTNAKKYATEIANDVAAANSIKVSGTPGFVIGIVDDEGTVKGKLIPGAYPYEYFDLVINYYLDQI